MLSNGDERKRQRLEETEEEGDERTKSLSCVERTRAGLRPVEDSAEVGG